jgi:DNA polymerase III delta prime subunit
MNNKRWLELLKWSNLPNFGPCHVLEFEDFKNNYFISDEIKNLEQNLIHVLESNNFSHLRIVGTPGLGKTTFLYYLKNKISLNQNITEKYCFYIFHANRADDERNYKQLIREEILYALKVFFQENNQNELFNRIHSQEITNKEKINKLMTIVKEYKQDFPKKLIFITDDVDLLSNDMAYKIAKTIKTDFEIHQVVKWLSIRGSTLEKFTGHSELAALIEEFYPAQYNLPYVSLFNIIKKRIYFTNGNDAKNPYSEDLCEIVKRIANENHRGSLPLLKSILEDNHPKGLLDHTDEKFIQIFLSRTLVRTFLNQGKIPNLHSSNFYIINNYPLLIDVLHTIAFSKTANKTITACSKIATHVRGKFMVEDPNDIFQINSADVQETIDLLLTLNLIYKQSGNLYNLTDKGKIIVNNISIKEYNKICFELLKNSGEEVNPDYMKLCNLNINYENYAKESRIWKNRN